MKKVKNPIGRRLIRNIIMVSTFFSIIATGIQLYSVYTSEKDLIISDLEQVKRSSVESLSLSLWQKNDEQINIQLKNLLKLHHITYASIEEDGILSYKFGKSLPKDSIRKQYELTYMYNYTKYVLGTLTLEVGLSHARNKVKENFYLIAVTQTMKTFIVAFIMLYIFSYMLTRHLYKIVEYADEVINNNSNIPLKLDMQMKDDELGLLQKTLNNLHVLMHTKLETSEEENSKLNELNLSLQEKILARKNLGNNTIVKSKDAQEILGMIEYIKKDCTSDDPISAVKRDVESLEILLKRAFKNP